MNGIKLQKDPRNNAGSKRKEGRNASRRLIACFLIAALLCSFLPFESAQAAGNSAVSVRVVTPENNAVQASVSVSSAAGYVSNGATSAETGLSRFAGLPAGEYRIAVSLPLGYALDTIQVGAGAPQPTPDNRSAAMVQLTDMEEIAVSFTCHKVDSPGFSASDSEVNAFSTLPMGKADVSMKTAPQTESGSYDIVVVLDYSASMSTDFNGVELPLPGEPYDTDQKNDYRAKNHPNSRYQALKDSLRSFLTSLKGSAHGRISFIIYGNVVRVASFYGSTFTSIENMDIEYTLAVLDGYRVYGGTRMDLAFEQARHTLASLPAPGGWPVPSERKVVFFTDGEPGKGGLGWMLKWETDYRMHEPYSQEYGENSYRVMAETYNQTDIIKAPYGINLTVNNFVLGKRPYLSNNPHLNDAYPMYKYYGASIKASTIGITKTDDYDQVPDGYYSGEFTEWYKEYNDLGYLSGFWKRAESWKNEHEGYSDYLFNDLSADPYLIDYKGSSPFPWNYASFKHGNYLRTAPGQEAEIYSVAIVDGNRQNGSPQEQEMHSTVMDFLGHTAGSDERVFVASDKEALKKAFDQVFVDITGAYEDVYLRFNVDSDWQVYTSEGVPVDDDRNKGMWREGNSLWAGPFTVSSDDDPLRSARFLIYVRSLAGLKGEYERSTGGAQPEMILRATLFQPNGSGGFEEVDTGQLWVQTITISEY